MQPLAETGIYAMVVAFVTNKKHIHACRYIGRTTICLTRQHDSEPLQWWQTICAFGMNIIAIAIVITMSICVYMYASVCMFHLKMVCNEFCTKNALQPCYVLQVLLQQPHYCYHHNHHHYHLYYYLIINGCLSLRNA